MLHITYKNLSAAYLQCGAAVACLVFGNIPKQEERKLDFFMNNMILKKITPDVKLGINVTINDFINLYGCAIGDNTKIGPFVEIQKNVQVGKNCKIQSHTFICEGVTIEDNVFIGHGVTFTNDTYPRATNRDGALTERRGLDGGTHSG